jgi:hypothetical protein
MGSDWLQLPVGLLPLVPMWELSYEGGHCDVFWLSFILLLVLRIFQTRKMTVAINRAPAAAPTPMPAMAPVDSAGAASESVGPPEVVAVSVGGGGGAVLVPLSPVVVEDVDEAGNEVVVWSSNIVPIVTNWVSSRFHVAQISGRGG